MRAPRGRELAEWASRSTEEQWAEVRDLRRRDSERRKLGEALQGARKECWRLEAEVTRLREKLIEEGVEPPAESWKPPRIERLEFAAREVERLKYGIGDAIRALREASETTEAWKDAQSRVDSAVVYLEQLMRSPT